MSRIRIAIGQLILQHPSMTTAEAARLGRMVESHLQVLLAASSAPSARNADYARAHSQLPSGPVAPPSETAMAIARGIHQSLSGKG